MNAPFTDEQKEYLAGFLAGSGLARSLATLPVLPASAATAAAAAPAAGPARPPRPEDVHLAAQDRFLAEGKTLAKEEQAKRDKHGLDVWDDVVAHAAEGRFPKGTDVFLFKFQGLFYVAPAQDSFMCRLRLPGGMISAHQARGVADLAERLAGGYADITTRANLQLRQVKPTDTVELVTGLHDLGILNRGAGADNVRNITASPTAGFDPRELIDVRPLACRLHHHVLNHRELYGLPRKFNVAFDGGGAVSVLEDTNDIGFAAVRVTADQAQGLKSLGVTEGVHFRLQLGGITGHQDFARDAGVLVRPDDCIPVADAAIRAFIDLGDRTDRKKARLKYVLDRIGHEGFLAEVEKRLGRQLPRVPLGACEVRPAPVKHAHVGIHPQRQGGLFYLGVVLPAGRLRADQLRALADLAADLGSGDLRLTVWQNVLIPDIPSARVDDALRRVEAMGLAWSASSVRAGLVACTGNGGCKFAASDTKTHALAIAAHVEASKVALDQPVNIHVTGCPHSCAQHYVGDVGLVGTKVAAGDDDVVEGYHLVVGGGAGAEQGVGRELLRDVPATEAPAVVERLLRAYLDHRESPAESFVQFTRRHEVEQLKELCAATPAPVPASS